MFDAQVVMSSLQMPRGKLMEQYVCARIVSMTGINIGLFDHDKHNSLYYYLMNADETIYMRYGGRDSESPETYLDFDSLELALREGLDMHEQYQRGELPPQEKRKPMYPRDVPLLKEEVVDRGRCVECHLISDYQTQEMEFDGTLDKLRWMYRSPDPKRVGLFFDVPKGLAVERVEGPAKDAGMQPGDILTHVEGIRVRTFGDFQYRYDQVPREAGQATFTVSRSGESRDLTLRLPKEWWWTDLYYRFWTVEPLLYIETRALTIEEKEKLSLPVDGFASEVIDVDPSAQVLNLHSLEEGDIIFDVDGVQRDDMVLRADLYIKLHKEAGERFDIKVLRDGKPMEMNIRAYRQYFRKAKL